MGLQWSWFESQPGNAAIDHSLAEFYVQTYVKIGEHCFSLIPSFKMIF